MPTRIAQPDRLDALAGLVIHLGLGRSYRLLHALAPRASTGAVWSALWLQGGVPVALKWLPGGDGQAPERAMQRIALRREAVALRQCQHPHVVRLHTVGTLSDEEPVLVLEQMHEAVHHHVQQHARPGAGLPVSEALRLSHQLAQALQALHRSGRRHLDVKPANLLISRPGPLGARLKLADFGACTPLAQPTHGFLGTPGWLAPEQCQPLTVPAPGGHLEFRSDARADVFAVGQVLYYLLSNQGSAWARQSHAASVSGTLIGLTPAQTNACALSAAELSQVDTWWRDDRPADEGSAPPSAAGSSTSTLAGDKPAPCIVDALTWHASTNHPPRPAADPPGVRGAEPSPSTAPPDVPPASPLSEALRRLCALQPEQRCADMGEVAQLLNGLRIAWCAERRQRRLLQQQKAAGRAAHR